jgi:hypothetical protein
MGAAAKDAVKVGSNIWSNLEESQNGIAPAATVPAGFAAA